MCPDWQTPPFPSKAQIVAHMYRTHDLAAHETLLLGDAEDDRIAAETNDIAFAAATYGVLARSSQSALGACPYDRIQL